MQENPELTKIGQCNLVMTPQLKHFLAYEITII